MDRIMPKRLWRIYLSCLEKPKSMKQVANEYGYRTQSALSQKYQGKVLHEWLVDKGLMRIHSKRGRELFYKSVKSTWLVNELDLKIHRLVQLRNKVR